MFKSIRMILLIVALLTLGLFGAPSHEWLLKEGEGSQVVKDAAGLAPGKLSGTGVTWTREDDRGAFLNFSDGYVDFGKNPDFRYANGFVAEIHFSADFTANTKTPWYGLFSQGRSWRQTGYTLMLKRDGSSVLLTLKGVKDWYQGVPIKIPSGRDCLLKIVVGDGKIRFYLNNKFAVERTYSGSLQYSDGSLRLGSSGGHPFYGNIYRFSLKPYAGENQQSAAKASQPAAQTVSKYAFPSLKLPDPAGTVILSDFGKYSADIQEGSKEATGVWISRKVKFFPQSNSVLYPPTEKYGDQIAVNPKLTGTYDIYLGCRVVTLPTAIFLRVGEKWYFIQTPGVGPVRHFSVEQPVARRVQMTGQAVTLASAGSSFMLAYLKFIPSDTPRKTDYPKFTDFQVTEGQAPSPEKYEAAQKQKIQERIDSGYYIERHFEETVTEPQYGAATRQRGFVAFQRNWMDLTFPNTVPQKDGAPALKVYGTAGEPMLSALAVRPLRNLGKVTLTQSAPLRSADGKEFKAEIKINLLEYARKRSTNYVGRSEFMNVPFYLEPANAFQGEAGKTRQFVLQIRSDAPAGTYRTSFALSAAGVKSSLEVPLEVTIYPFKLVNPPEEYGFWTYNSFNSELPGIINDQADYGCNSVVIHANAVLAFRKNSAGVPEIDWERSALPALAKVMRERQMNGRIHLLAAHIYEQFRSLPRPEMEKLYPEFLRQLNAKCVENNYPPIVFHSFDEVLSHAHQIPLFVDDVNLQRKSGVKTGNDHIWFKTSRPWQKEVDQVSSAIDVFVLRASTRKLFYVDDWEDILAEGKRRGVEVLAYNSNNALMNSLAVSMRFCNGWFYNSKFGRGCAGLLTYAWRITGGNPLDDLDDTDFIYLVPPHDQRQGGPTCDLLGLQAGRIDLRYIRTLEAAVAAGKKRGKDTSDAEALLKRLNNSFDWELYRKNTVFFEPKFERLYEKGGKRFAAGKFNLLNGWSLDDYDANRRLVANAILKLSND